MPTSETFVTGVAQDVAAASADIRPRQQGAIEQGGEAVMRYHRGALTLAKEALAEYAFDGAAGVIGAEAEQESAAGLMLLQQVDQRGNTEPGPFSVSTSILSARYFFMMFLLGYAHYASHDIAQRKSKASSRQVSEAAEKIRPCRALSAPRRPRSRRIGAMQIDDPRRAQTPYELVAASQP